MTNCPACQKPLATWPMGAKNGFAFIACKTCGSVMTDPFPTREGLNTFYRSLDPAPAPAHLPNPSAEIIHIKKRIAKAAAGISGRRFLDVSCRQGYTVAAAREMGFDAHGIDVYPFFVKFAQEQYGAEYFSQTESRDYAETGAQADLIFSIQSFSDQPDIESHAAALSKLLAPGGKIYMEEADGNSLWLPRTFDRWGFATPPINFLYLSFEGMEALLRRHGLKVLHKYFVWQPFMRLVVGK